MTESCSTIRRNGAPAGAFVALLKKKPARTTKERQNMNQTVSVQGEAAFNSVMADLGLDFALSPIHRIGFDIDVRGIQLLAERYTKHVFRARHGDDIVAWIAKVNETTISRAGGLTIFEGPPGTGKTSLITQMIRREKVPAGAT